MLSFLREVGRMLKDPWFWATLMLCVAGWFLMLTLAMGPPKAGAAPVKVEALESLKRQRYCRDLAGLAFEALMDFRRSPGVRINAVDPVDQMVIDLAEHWQGTAIELRRKVMADCSRQQI